MVCALGWGFDTFDQQLFAIVRTQALADVMHLDPTSPTVTSMATYATSIMLIGWATGGIFFGIMGDKMGRAKTMIFTILTYAIFTGMSGLAVHWYDFLLYRFLTGLGIGGQFAAGVTLLSETMPDRARPKTLGMLQIVGAAGNMLAGSLQMLFAVLATYGFFGDYPTWRILFFVGFLPAMLAIVVFRYLEEPEKWKNAIAEGGVKKVGSISDLFSEPQLRYNVIVGMLLATCGVIGLWGIGFFSIDLTRTAFRNGANDQIRVEKGYETDFEFVRLLVADPEKGLQIAADKKVTALSLVGSKSGTNEAALIFAAVSKLKAEQQSINPESVVRVIAEEKKGPLKSVGEKTPSELCQEVLIAPLGTVSVEKLTTLADSISDRAKKIGTRVGYWAGIASLLFNFGAIIGTYVFTMGAERIGRRPTFTIAFAASLVSTLIVFLTMRDWTQVLWMQPMLGFCTLSLFGGYAIYFPELFPTRLRSTAISFCYNIGRFAAATGPAGLGLLTSYVFYDTAEPIRYAGAAMSITFVFGIIVTWLGPETKGKPLPE